MPRKKKEVKVRLSNLDDARAVAASLPRRKREGVSLEIQDPEAETSPIKAELDSVALKLSTTIPVTIYTQDPEAAKRHPGLGLQDVEVSWEPGLMDGPTSARVMVRDHDSDTRKLTEAAHWDQEAWRFVGPGGQEIGRDDRDSPQFHQVHVWAIIQEILAFYEHPEVMGRPVPWAFDGNRLTVAPHAGYDENAFYDRDSKSLQFCYFDTQVGRTRKRVYTCLSHDIVAHETGHAILDGVRPYYYECTSLETSAFHEFVADLTAMLSALRNNDVRHVMAGAWKKTGDEDAELKVIVWNLAEEFGKHVEKRPYLRSAHNDLRMQDIEGCSSPHYCSQVLSGVVFDIYTRIVARHIQNGATVREALSRAIPTIRRLTLQSLDLCPPVDIRFIDYVRAMLHAHQLSNRQDVGKFQEYEKILRDVFHERGFSDLDWPYDLDYHLRRVRFGRYGIGRLSRSRTAAYHFLHDNRDALCIPAHQDIVVVDLYDTLKTDMPLRLPRQIVLEYVWHEKVGLRGARFGRLRGRTIPLLCGGTLVFDERGNILSWFHKPGTGFRTSTGSKKARDEAARDREAGQERREQLLDHIAELEARGLIHLADGEEVDDSKPLVARPREGGGLRLDVVPRLRHWGED